MFVVMLTGTSDHPQVKVREVEKPDDHPGRMVIEVASVGITKIESHGITGWQKPNGTLQEQLVVLGCEFAGCVHSFGSGVHNFAVGNTSWV